MDRRISKTKRAIREAYDKLLVEKNGGKITISDIAREANIDRKTFYLHYDSIEAITREFCRRKVHDIMHELNRGWTARQKVPITDFLIAVDRLVTDNYSHIRLLFRQNQDYFLRIANQELCEALVLAYQTFFTAPVPQQKLYAEIYVTGIMSVYVKWLAAKRPIPIECLADMVEKACVEGIGAITPKH